MSRLTLVSPGALSTIQDNGRRGWRRFGMPWSGPLDPEALQLANALAGNEVGAPAIEFFLSGPTIRAEDGPVRIAMAGDFDVEIRGEDGPTRGGSWRSLTLRPGTIARFGTPRGSRVGYLAIYGLQVPQVLGSASTYARANLGGYQGRPLVAGDVLTVGEPVGALGDGPTAEGFLTSIPKSESGPIRIVLGPQDDYFTAESVADLLTTPYRITKEADRMGVRLDGRPLRHDPTKGQEIISDGTVLGSIQVPGNGKPIVLLAEGQTAGGYPKIATVISVDLPRLATAPVDSEIRFAVVSSEVAEALARQNHHVQLQRLASIKRRVFVDGVDLESLYGDNLLSGMVDANFPNHIDGALLPENF